MKYSAKNLAKAFLKLAQENPQHQQKIAVAFVDFCKKKGLGYLMPNFLRYLKIEAGRDEDAKTLKIFSTIKLGQDAVKKIQKACQASDNPPVELAEDKNIIAGFVAYYKNKIIDASLSSNLRILKNKITA